MPIRIHTREDKTAVLDEVDRLVYRHLLAGMKPTDQALVRAHMASLRARPDDLHINFRFETLPHLNSTRIHLELSYDSIPGFDTKESQEA